MFGNTKQTKGENHLKETESELNPNAFNNYYCCVADTLIKNIFSLNDSLINLNKINVWENLILHNTNVTESVSVICFGQS